MTATRLRCGLACLLLALAATHAHAAGFDISPTRAVLDATHPVRSLRLRNGTTAPVSFEVAVKRWSMDAKGEWKLEDLVGATDLVVHPLAFELAPGQTQLLRVGLAGQPRAGDEQAYRLILRELPPRKDARSVKGIGVLTQLSLPVFVSDGLAKAELQLDPGSVRQGRWRYLLRATGKAHLDAHKFTLRLLDAQGAVLSTQPVVHGYVLAGASLPVDVKLEPQACRDARRFELVAAPPLAPITGALPPAPRSCLP